MSTRDILTVSTRDLGLKLSDLWQIQFPSFDKSHTLYRVPSDPLVALTQVIDGNVMAENDGMSNSEIK